MIGESENEQECARPFPALVGTVTPEEHEPYAGPLPDELRAWLAGVRRRA